LTCINSVMFRSIYETFSSTILKTFLQHFACDDSILNSFHCFCLKKSYIINKSLNNSYWSVQTCRDERERCISGRDYLQTRQSSGAVGNGAEGHESTSPLDCTPRASMTMAVTTSALPMQPIYVSAESCSAADVPTNLQRRRLWQLQQEPQELSLTRSMDMAASSSSILDEPVRTPLSTNVLLSLPASPKRSSASHSSSSKTPISKSQMKGELKFFNRSVFFSSLIALLESKIK